MRAELLPEEKQRILSPAVLGDTGATVLVTASAMRLLGWRGRNAGGSLSE